jgi:hypothetical protein
MYYSVFSRSLVSRSENSGGQQSSVTMQLNESYMNLKEIWWICVQKLYESLNIHIC